MGTIQRARGTSYRGVCRSEYLPMVLVRVGAWKVYVQYSQRLCKETTLWPGAPLLTFKFRGLHYSFGRWPGSERRPLLRNALTLPISVTLFFTSPLLSPRRRQFSESDQRCERPVSNAHSRALEDTHLPFDSNGHPTYNIQFERPRSATWAVSTSSKCYEQLDTRARCHRKARLRRLAKLWSMASSRKNTGRACISLPAR